MRQSDIRDVIAERELVDQLQQVVRVEGPLPAMLFSVALAGVEQSLRYLLVGGELEQAVGCEPIGQMSQRFAQLLHERLGDLVVVLQTGKNGGVDGVLCRVELEQSPVLVEEDAFDHDDERPERFATSIIFLTFSRLASSRNAEKSIMKPPPLPQTSASRRQ